MEKVFENELKGTISNDYREVAKATLKTFSEHIDRMILAELQRETPTDIPEFVGMKINQTVTINAYKRVKKQAETLAKAI